MTEFDRKVLTWLNDADIPDKSKATVLKRTRLSTGIYKDMLESDAKVLERLPIDTSLDDVCARAERRLQEGLTPVVVIPTAVPQLTLRRMGTATPATGTTPRGFARSASGASGTGAYQRGASNASQQPDVGPSSSGVQRPIATPRGGTASARASLVSKPGPKKNYGAVQSKLAAGSNYRGASSV